MLPFDPILLGVTFS